MEHQTNELNFHQASHAANAQADYSCYYGFAQFMTPEINLFPLPFLNSAALFV